MLYGYRQPHCSCKHRDIYKEIVEDVETRFDTSNYDLDRSLPKRKYKIVIGLMKDGNHGNRKIMIVFVSLSARPYSYLKGKNDEDKKAKGTKKCVIKKPLNFKIIKTV